MMQKNQKREYIIFQPPDNEEVRSAVKMWLIEAKGCLPLVEIERRFNEQFHFFYPQIYTEDEMSSSSPIGSWKKFAFLLEENIVFLIP